MSIAISTSATAADFDQLVARTRDVLKDNGFGVLTEIDVQATLKEKLGDEAADIGRYLILGACNPKLAQQAVTAEKKIGVLLPCNVVLRADAADPSTVHIEAMNPQLMSQVVDNPALVPIAEQVTQQIRAVIDTLADTSDPRSN